MVFYFILMDHVLRYPYEISHRSYVSCRYSFLIMSPPRRSTFASIYNLIHFMLRCDYYLFLFIVFHIYTPVSFISLHASFMNKIINYNRLFFITWFLLLLKTLSHVIIIPSFICFFFQFVIIIMFFVTFLQWISIFCAH